MLRRRLKGLWSMSDLRVLHVLGDLDFGGIQQFLINYQGHLPSDVKFDYAVLCEGTGALEQRARELGARVLHIPTFLKGDCHSFANAFDAVLSTGHYDAVHCHLDKMSLPPLFLAMRHNVPMRVVHAHSLSESPHLRRRLMKYVFRVLSVGVVTDRFGCSVEACRFLYGERASRRATVIPNAVDTRRFAFNGELRDTIRGELGIGGLCIGNVGRRSEQKNQAFLIDVLAALRNRGMDATLLLVGPAANDEELVRAAEQRGCADAVRMTGLVDDPETYLSAMDVFCFPSLYEGLGIAAVEAQLNGLGIVASNGVPKSVDVTGRVAFVDLEDGAESWADCIVAASMRHEMSEGDLRATGYEIRDAAPALAELYRNRVAELRCGLDG